MALGYNYQQNINGLVFGYSDIILKVNGQTFSQVETINYDHTTTREEFVGTSPEAAGRTAGYASYKASFTMSLEDADKFMKILGTPLNVKLFVITVMYANPTKPLITDTLFGCLVDSFTTNTSKGGAVKRQFNISVQHIDYNGVSLY